MLNLTKALAPLVALLAALGYADYANALQVFLDAIPAWLQAASVFVTAAAGIAALTPTKRDDKFLRKVKAVLNSWALNLGAAKNKEDD